MHRLSPRRRPGSVVLLCALMLSLGSLAACATSPNARSSGRFDSTLSANVITAEEIQRYPSSVSVEEILERHSPGFWLRRRNEPGGAISVNMLGMGAPLFVVDGIPVEQYGGTLGLNPRDIEIIEVWKYGATTSLWGLRGANGVVLIRTKRVEQ